MASFTLSWAIRLMLVIGLASSVSAFGHPLKTTHRKHGYNLVDHYRAHDFFDHFRFFDHPDPTNGFVQYVDRHTANKTGLIKVHKNHTYVGVDHETVLDPLGPGRKSVRLESHKAYTHGLFILSLDHMPHGCGTWPAYWTLGPRWPFTGEIDIIEGVNNNNYNLMSLHTSQGCSIAGDNQVGKLITNDCDSLHVNTGCGVLHNATRSYGKGFNQAGGGVYAMEWTANFIKIWKFHHGRIPKSLRDGNPKPEKDFGRPDANLAGSCNIDQHFREHYIVFDNTFCGDFAGGSYGSTQCPYAARGQQGCNEFVARNPQAFTKAYWHINHLKVYQNHDASVRKYNPHYYSYSSVVPVASATPSIVSSLLPPGNGHNTTANHAPTSLTASLHVSNASPTTTRTSSHRHSLTSTAHKTHTPSKSDSSITRRRSTSIESSSTFTRRPTSTDSSSTFTRRPTGTETTSTFPRQRTSSSSRRGTTTSTQITQSTTISQRRSTTESSRRIITEPTVTSHSSKPVFTQRPGSEASTSYTYTRRPFTSQSQEPAQPLSSLLGHQQLHQDSRKASQNLHNAQAVNHHDKTPHHDEEHRKAAAHHEQHEYTEHHGNHHHKDSEHN